MATQAPQSATESPEQPDRPDVFVSYSRQDKPFVETRLLASLAARSKDVWIDLEDIPPATDWRERIWDGIEAARAFVFVLSPSSLGSEICRQELRRAIEGNKRLIPVLRQEVDRTAVPDELERPNWIFLRDEDDFDVQFERLVEALETDLDWVDMHARLGVRAREWARAGQDRSLLLRGSDLQTAERWLAQQGSHAEAATPDQSQYIVASRHAAARRQRLRLGALAAALVISLGLAVVAVLQREEARAQRDKALSLSLAANSADNLGVDPELSLLLAIEAVDRSATTPAREALRQGLQAARWNTIIRPPGKALETASDVDGNGRLMVTPGRLSTATIWDARTGRRLRELRGHQAAVRSAVFSPDGRRVVTTATDGSARVWDSGTGASMAEIPGRGDRTPSPDFEPFADFSPNGKLIFAVGRRVTRLWDVADRRVVAELTVPGPEFGVDVEVSADGRQVVTTRELEEVAQIWDVATGRLVRSLKGDFSSARFSPNGRLIVTSGGTTSPGIIWDARSGRRLIALRSKEGISPDSATFGPDGKSVLATYLEDAYMFSARTGASLARLRGHHDDITSAEDSPDGRRVVTASADGTARVWDASSGRSLEVLRGHTRAVAAAQFSRDGRTIATLSEDNTVRIWATAGRDTVNLIASRGAEDAEFSPNGRLVVTMAEERPVLPVWHAASGRRVTTLRVPGERFSDARFSPRGDILATEIERGVRLWSTKSWRTTATLEGHSDLLRGLEFSRDGSRLLTISFDDTMRVWDTASGRPLANFSAANVEEAQFTPDGTEIVAVWDKVKTVGSVDYHGGRVESWNIQTGRRRIWHAQERQSLSNIESNPDGRMLLASGPENVVVFDAANGKRVSTIREPETGSGLTNVARFNPDGERIVTVNDDNLARIWQARTGRRVIELKRHKGDVEDARFSPDGSFLVTIASDGTSRAWDARTGASVGVYRGHERGDLVATASFSPDGTRILTADGASVRIIRCELCMPIDEQLRLARKRVARSLSEAERRDSGLPAEE